MSPEFQQLFRAVEILARDAGDTQPHNFREGWPDDSMPARNDRMTADT